MFNYANQNKYEQFQTFVETKHGEREKKKKKEKEKRDPLALIGE